MLAVAKGSVYIERTAVNNPANILKTKKAIAKAFRLQLEGYGFSLVEVLSPCPTNWKMSPSEACKWIDEVMAVHFPLGVLKDIVGEKKDAH
jgi:2-oxoglutarate ferredoxin oxidoreductase subunit beta